MTAYPRLKKLPAEKETLALSVLWNAGDKGATVAEIKEIVEGSGKAYTTILSLLQYMERKGWVRHERDREEGRRYRYYAVLHRQEGRRMVFEVMDRRPSIREAITNEEGFTALLEAVSDEELDHIHDLVRTKIAQIKQK